MNETQKCHSVNFNRPASKAGGKSSTGRIDVFLDYIGDACVQDDPFEESGDSFEMAFRFDWEKGAPRDSRTWHLVKWAVDISDKFMRDLRLAACAAMRELQTIFAALGCPDALQQGLPYRRLPHFFPCGGLLAKTVKPRYWDQFDLNMRDATAYSFVVVLAVQHRIRIAKKLGLGDWATAEEIVRKIAVTIATETTKTAKTTKTAETTKTAKTAKTTAVPSKRDGSGVSSGNVDLRQETVRRIKTRHLRLRILRFTKLAIPKEDRGSAYDKDAEYYINTLGIPKTLVSLLAALQKHLRERYCTKDLRRLTQKFPEAIRADTDLSNVWTEFIVWLLTDRQDGLVADAAPPLKANELAVIESVAELFRQQCCEKEAWRTIARPPAKRRRHGNEEVVATARKVAGIMAALPEIDMAALPVETVKAILEQLVQQIALDFKRANGPYVADDSGDRSIHYLYCRQMYGHISNKLLELLAAAPFCE